jgi:hypothetical protein
MAESFPNALEMREIKYGPKTSREERVALARRLEAAGRVAEALDLYLLAGDEAGLASVRARAVREGRPILLLMLARANRAVSSEEWRSAAEAAFAAERWRDAFRAYSEAGDEAGLARVREKIPDYLVFTPQGK